MKKIIYFLLTFQMIILSLYGLQFFKENKMNKLLYKGHTSILLNFDKPRKHSYHYGDYLQKLGDKYHTPISKYVFKDDHHLIIYTSDPSLKGQIKLKEGQLPEPHSEAFISNFKSSHSKESGVFPRSDPKTDIVIKRITQTQNLGADGIYYLSTQNEQLINKLIKDINDNVASVKILDTYHSNVLPPNLILWANLLLVSLCLVISVIHYALSRNRDIAILRINGHRSWHILKHMFLSLLPVFSMSILSSYCTLSVYYIFINGLNYFGTLSLLFILVLLAGFFSIAVPLLIVTAWLINDMKTIDIVKGRKRYAVVLVLHGILKVVFLVFLLLSIYQLAEKSSLLKHDLEGLSVWNKTKNLYTTAVSYTGENDRSKEYDTSKRMKKFYFEMQKKDGFIMEASNYDKLDNQYIYDLNSEGENARLSPDGKSVTVDENYLKYNPIKTNGNADNTMKRIVHKDYVRNILVPYSLKKYESQIKKNFLSDFYYKKVEVENIYNKSLNMPENKTKMSDLKINIIYVDDNQKYFTYDSSIKPADKNQITDPIAVVETGNIDGSYYLSYISGCFYFYSKQNDAYGDILPIIRKSNAGSSIQNVVSVYDQHGQEIQQLKQEKTSLLLMAIVLILSSFMITYNLVASYYEKNKYTLYIKKIFGYSGLKRNNKFLMAIFLVNFIPVAILGLLKGDIVFLTGIIIFILEMILVFGFDKMLSRKAFNSIIKGDH
ncbi:putative ABC transport system permease protein [Scopulibacillus daqui]|uniref:ABC transport system permease protein n=1 Tax=Scopulibacillus daqui TaxID=1469162 RepID=A0ABS2Q2S0_9BACL|nr:DUF1430 domain-containing protein [Scopulibacillus daqui]MBM7645994.1 putative ABC transport system permease protein [Scopulibacillus daqui]